MKKISILTFHKERETVVDILQDLGVIHLEIDRSYRNADVDDLEKQQSQLQKAMESIRESEGKGEGPLASEELTVDEVVASISDLRMKMDSIGQQLDTLAKEKLLLTPWGDFNRERLQLIRDQGIRVSFFMADQRAFNRYDFADLQTHVIHAGGKRTYFVVFSEKELGELPFEEVVLPTHSLREVEEREHSLWGESDRLERQISSYSSHATKLQGALDDVQFTLSYYQAGGSFTEHGNGTIQSIRGWFPASIQGRLEHYLRKSQITYLIESPGAGDNAPVLLRNARFPKLFESITNIFQLPGYYELDLTPFIAVFYPIFFAYCLGDAGYGLVLLVGATVGLFTFLKGARNIATLGIVLGLFTTVMGVVKSGSVFGIPLTGSDHPFLAYLSQFVIIHDDRSFVFNAFNVALMVGVVQIFVGVLLAISNKLIYQGWVAALPVFGKLMIITSAICLFLAGNQGVTSLQPLSALFQALIVAGILLVLVSHDTALPLGRRIPAGLLPLFFIFTGLLGDTLSYVRLFALGVASAVLGLVVNQIGMQIMGDSWWTIAIGILFLLFGHTLNLALATLGAFVHPLRLTFVEFYNNAEFQGGGVAYEPFRKRLKSIMNIKQ